MNYRDDDERAFYDACYDNWRRGGSADLSHDDFDHYRSQGFDPDESAQMLIQQEIEYERRMQEQRLENERFLEDER